MQLFLTFIEILSLVDNDQKLVVIMFFFFKCRMLFVFHIHKIYSGLTVLTCIADFKIFKSDSTKSGMLKIVSSLTVGRVHTNIKRSCFILVEKPCKCRFLDILQY